MNRLILAIAVLTFSISSVAQASTAPTAVVQRGEGLSQFSLRVLGTSRRWREIFRLNTDRIVNANLVYEGTVLRLPEGSVALNASARPAKMASLAGQAGREERVHPGESLSEFSLRVLGTCKLWPRIYAWNRDRISNPNLVEAGTLLRLSAHTVAVAHPVVAARALAPVPASAPAPARKIARVDQRMVAAVAIPARPVHSESAIISSDISPDVSTEPAQPLKPYSKMELPF